MAFKKEVSGEKHTLNNPQLKSSKSSNNIENHTFFMNNKAEIEKPFNAEGKNSQ